VKINPLSVINSQTISSLDVLNVTGNFGEDESVKYKKEN